MDEQTLARLNELMSVEQDATKHALLCLRLVTGQPHAIAQSSSRIWGKDGEVETGLFYQIMPDSGLSGNEDFFNWYCTTRMDYQFFRTVEEATIHFVTYWQVWQREVVKKGF